MWGGGRLAVFFVILVHPGQKGHNGKSGRKSQPLCPIFMQRGCGDSHDFWLLVYRSCPWSGLSLFLVCARKGRRVSLFWHGRDFDKSGILMCIPSGIPVLYLGA